MIKRYDINNIDHLKHYTQGQIECIDGIESALGFEGFKSYCQGNCLKYLWRYKNKGGIEDLKKCKWYLDKLISSEESYQSKRLQNLTNNAYNFTATKNLVNNKSAPRKFLDKNKEEIVIGQTYFGDDGMAWEIKGITNNKAYPLVGYNAEKGFLWLKPKWLHKTTNTEKSTTSLSY